MVDLLKNQVQTGASPFLTVAMPVYNAGKYLRLAVISIVRQTFRDWELLVIDDGSTDNALQGIADIIDPRIHIMRDGTNKGLAARLNEAIGLARGQYIARMDQDDVSYPDRFMRQIEMLEKDKCLDLVATRAITIDEYSMASGFLPYRISHEKICARPWIGFYMPHPTWMGKTDWFRRHGYTIPGPYFCEDQDLLLRSYTDSKFGTVPEILFAYRLRSKLNTKKLFSTRRAVAGLQCRQFMAKRELSNFLLCLVVFVGRISTDTLKFLRLLSFLKKQPKPIQTEDLMQWNEVNHTLSSV